MPDFNNTELAQHAFLLLRRTAQGEVPGDAIDELELYVNEIEKELEERTGYLPSAYASIQWQKVARYYAVWQYLAADPENMAAARLMRTNMNRAIDLWEKSASIEFNYDFFNEANNRRRMQDFKAPNLSADKELSQLTTRWDENDIDHTQDVFSKPPVVADIAIAASTATPTVVFDASADASDPEGRLDVTSVEVITGPNDGSASVNATTGDITYTSDGGFTGTDILTARILDDEDKEATFKITITVS